MFIQCSSCGMSCGGGYTTKKGNYIFCKATVSIPSTRTGTPSERKEGEDAVRLLQIEQENDSHTGEES